MATQQENKQVTIDNNFLTKHEQTVCMQLANSESPHSQRALALLALNEGNTQGQAADKTSLSLGQVKYLAGKFRKERLGVFPEALVGKLGTKSNAKTPTKVGEGEKTVTEKGGTAKDKSKSTKAGKKNKVKKKDKKSGKKTDKAKKEKKNKKDKKEKKEKKRSKNKNK